MDIMIKLLPLSALGLALAACVPATPPYLSAPADPAVSVRDPAPVAATSGVRTYQVVEPKDWIEMNRAVGPKGNGE